MKASVAALKSSGGGDYKGEWGYWGGGVTIKGKGAGGEGGDYKGGTLGVGTPIVLHSQHVNTRFKLGGRVKSD